MAVLQTACWYVVRLKLFTAVAALVLTLVPTHAQERIRGVVELFTSQGCDSCPKADAVLSTMARQEGVVALAYHVDYWDYRGWRDTLAAPENTDRQREYADALGARTVYTPQAVINGRTHVNGADRKAVERELGANDDALPVQVSVRKENGVLTIDVGELAGPKQNAHVVLISYDAANPVTIERGENAGKTVTYSHAVRSMQTPGVWHGKPAHFEIPMSEVVKKGNGGCAVLVQTVDAEGRPSKILGAAMLRFRGSAAATRN
nr:DUF1223 domain-containing protein [Tianweitania sediminis]